MTSNPKKKSKFQMRFPPMTLHDLARCSNRWATGDSMESNGEMWVFDWKCIMQSHSHIMTWHIWTHNCIVQSHWGISTMEQSQRVKKRSKSYQQVLKETSHVMTSTRKNVWVPEGIWTLQGWENCVLSLVLWAWLQAEKLTVTLTFSLHWKES